MFTVHFLHKDRARTSTLVLSHLDEYEHLWVQLVLPRAFERFPGSTCWVQNSPFASLIWGALALANFALSGVNREALQSRWHAALQLARVDVLSLSNYNWTLNNTSCVYFKIVLIVSERSNISGWALVLYPLTLAEFSCLCSVVTNKAGVANGTFFLHIHCMPDFKMWYLYKSIYTRTTLSLLETLVSHTHIQYWLSIVWM